MFARRDSGDVRIEISSLIDVVFLLLIFFIVTTRFVEQRGVEVELPQAEGEGHEVEQQVTGQRLVGRLVGRGHLRLVGADERGVGWLEGLLVALQPALRRLRVPPLAPRKLSRLLLQSLLGPLVVAEHRRIEVELDELADPAQHFDLQAAFSVR